MLNFFEYNWQIRDEWFSWCHQLSAEELNKDRTGGVGSIVYTLFHIVDVEYSWLRSIQGKEDVIVKFADYNTVQKVKALSDTYQKENANFLKLAEFNDELVSVHWEVEKYSRNEIIHHVIAHEIHHIGQLSIWARELELAPIQANFIGRKLTPVHYY
ncbi:DinB family protein [Bacillus sp. Bva_UNVM-123]|uniref:DinB family protein n=1 Tax=Bacillus sp. Bva_UNVM-123 TaxID=2829798 RepID=UPI00391EE337